MTTRIGKFHTHALCNICRMNPVRSNQANKLQGVIWWILFLPQKAETKSKTSEDG